MTPSLPYKPDLLLSCALDVIREASQIILDIRKRGFQTEIKPDSSQVTEADKASEICILARLRQYFPDIVAIGEEETADGCNLIPGDTYWLVDPLDGTKGFANGRDDFAVNIGLVSHHRPVLGAVALPAFGQFYTGGAGIPPLRYSATGAEAIHTVMPDPSGLRVLTSTHNHSETLMTRWLKGRAVHSRQAMGSAIKIMRVAEGAADFYPRCGPTMEWDTAGPQAVLEAAGGHLFDNQGHVLHYGKENLRNPPFYCTGPCL